MALYKSVCLVAVCMAMPNRPLEHISCCVFVWVATACLVLWAGKLDILDTVRCAVKELGLRNIWFLSVLLQVIFAHGSSTSSGMLSFMNQGAQRDVMYFITICLQFHLEDAPSVFAVHFVSI
jgi:hypothetical protein